MRSRPDPSHPPLFHPLFLCACSVVIRKTIAPVLWCSVRCLLLLSLVMFAAGGRGPSRLPQAAETVFRCYVQPRSTIRSLMSNAVTTSSRSSTQSYSCSPEATVTPVHLPEKIYWTWAAPSHVPGSPRIISFVYVPSSHLPLI